MATNIYIPGLERGSRIGRSENNYIITGHRAGASVRRRGHDVEPQSSWERIAPAHHEEVDEAFEHVDGDRDWAELTKWVELDFAFYEFFPNWPENRAPNYNLLRTELTKLGFTVEEIKQALKRKARGGGDGAC